MKLNQNKYTSNVYEKAYQGKRQTECCTFDPAENLKLKIAYLNSCIMGLHFFFLFVIFKCADPFRGASVLVMMCF